MEEIKKEIDGLIDLIVESSLYKNYRNILERMEKSDDINKLIEEIKLLQKKAVREEYAHDQKAQDETETLLIERNKELNNIPLYQEYLVVVEELNDMFLNIRDKVQDVINN